MSFKIEFETSEGDFSEHPGREGANVLRNLADDFARFLDPDVITAIGDVTNTVGDVVGTWNYKRDE